MKYQIVEVNQFPFEVPLLETGTPLSAKVVSTIHVYPTGDNPNIYPLRLDLKNRINLFTGEHLFSYICEIKFLIEDDGIPMKEEEFNQFVRNLHFNFEIGWEKHTVGTPLHGTTVPTVDSNIEQFKKQILDSLPPNT